MRLLLLGTSGCHLCEQAELIVNECLSDGPNGLVVETIDIAVQEVWHELYALRIPVLFSPDTNLELAWPFDHNRARDFILLADQIARTPTPSP